MTSRSVYSKVVGGSSSPVASGPSGLRCVCVIALPCRLRRHQALGYFVEGVGELLRAGHIADSSDIVTHILNRDGGAEHRTLALDDSGAADVARARREYVAGHLAALGA